MKRLLYLIFVLGSLTARAQSVDGGLKTLTATGTDTYVISEPLPAAYDPKERFLVRFTNGNSGASTLNRAALGVKAIQKAGAVALSSGDIVAGGTYLLSYNGTYYQLVGDGGSGGGGGSGDVVGPGSSVNNNVVFFNGTTGKLIKDSGLTLSGTNTGDQASAALTKVDDTNVTLTLGGSPSTALLAASSITAGWTGTLADARITSSGNWNTAYTNRITSLTTTGSSGASTLISNTLNIPTYTLAGLGGIASGTAWLLPSGGTATGTNTFAMGTFPFIMTTGVTTGTGATAGHQLVGNSLTTGNLFDASSSSVTTGSLGVFTSTSTVIDHTAGTNGLVEISMSGANSTASKTAIGLYSKVINTGTTNTNIAGYFEASGGTTNLALRTLGSVFIANASGDTPTASTRLDVRGIGTTTNSTLRLADSGNTTTLLHRDDGLFRVTSNGATTNYIELTPGTGSFITFSNPTGSASIGVQSGSANFAWVNKGFYVGGTLTFSNQTFADTNAPTILRTTGSTGLSGTTYTGRLGTTIGTSGHTFTSIQSEATSGTNTIVTLNSTYTASANSNHYTMLNIVPTYDITGSTRNIYGVNYEPVLTNMTGVTHIAFRSTSGNWAMQGSATTLTLGGGATASDLRFLEPSGSGANYTAFKAVAQGADITYSLPPTVGAANSVLTDVVGNGVLTWTVPAGSGDMVLASAQTSTGKKTFSVTGAIAGINVGANATDPTTTLAAGDIYYQTGVGLRQYSGSAWSTVGGGITNTAAANEIMKSNGTNAVPSGFFSTTAGDLLFGTGLAGTSRTIEAQGSAANVGLTLTTKGSGNLIFTVNSAFHSFTGTVAAFQFSTLDGFQFNQNGAYFTKNTGTSNSLAGAEGTVSSTSGNDLSISGGAGYNVGTTNGGSLSFASGLPNSGGTEGSINIQTRATGKLGFFNATAVVKQSAVTTPQGIADALTAYGLLPTSTVSSGGSGLTYAQTKAIAMKIK